MCPFHTIQYAAIIVISHLGSVEQIFCGLARCVYYV